MTYHSWFARSRRAARGTTLRNPARMAIAIATAMAAVACSASGDGDVAPSASRRNSGSGKVDTKSPFDIANATEKQDNGSSSKCVETSAELQKSAADIIFIIDNSGSMSEETAQVQANVNAFAQKIAGATIDYRVTFITSATSNLSRHTYGICVPPPLGGATCGESSSVFQHVNQAVASTNALSLLLATFTQWQGTLRPDATKVFVVVTDDNSAMPASDFDTSLLGMSPEQFGTAARRKYVFHSIAGWKEGTPMLSSTACNSAVNNGSEYQTLSQMTGGIVDSVCKASYASVLDNLAKGVVARASCELKLPPLASADPTKVEVRLSNGNSAPTSLVQVTDVSKCAQNPDAWYYDDNKEPTKILLCDGACNDASQAGGTKLEALMGCKVSMPR